MAQSEGASCFRAIRLGDSGEEIWNHWMNSSGLEFKSFSRGCGGAWCTEHRQQYSKVLQGQQKTKYLVWTFVIHSARKMKAFALLDLLMAMVEDHTIRVVQQHFQFSFHCPSWSLLLFNKTIRDYQYNSDFFKGTV